MEAVTRRNWTITEDFSSPLGIHAFVTDEAGRVWEVLVHPIYAPITVFDVTLLQGWEWLVEGRQQHETGQPMSRDDAWERALRYIQSESSDPDADA